MTTSTKRTDTDARTRIYNKLAEEGGGTWATYMMMDIDEAFATTTTNESPAPRSSDAAPPPAPGFNAVANTIERLVYAANGAAVFGVGDAATAVRKLYTHAAPEPPAVTGEEQRPAPQAGERLIGGTNFCGHAIMAVLCPICSPAPQPPVEGLREALEFYADPFAWKSKHDPDNVIQVPDFYSETSFGDTALEALAALASPSLTAGVTDQMIERGVEALVSALDKPFPPGDPYYQWTVVRAVLTAVLAAPATLIEQSGQKRRER